MTTKTMSSTTTTNGGGEEEEEEEEEGRDLISELPDPILHCILSSLDMTTVFQTSFFSKRWRYLWTTLPFLNFDNKVYYDSSCSTFSSKNDMMFFVDRVLILRNNNNHNSNIQSFRFSHNGGDTTTSAAADLNKIVHHISTWIHILIRSNVQEIHIKLNSDGTPGLDPFTLPMSLVTSKSLKTFKLDFGADFGLESTKFFTPCLRLEIPQLTTTQTMMICLPALKTLHLENLLIGNSVQLLISKCLALETLIMNYCFEGSQRLNICNPQIKSLTIKRMFTEFCDINVSAPKLTSLSCNINIDFLGRYSFTDVSSLVHAKIIIEPMFEDFDDGNEMDPPVTRKNVIDCLIGICNVRCLTLSAALLLELVTEVPPERLESLQIKPFCNLRYLKLKTSFHKSEIRAMTYMLKHCPNLQCLVLKVNDFQNPDHVPQEDCWEADLAPQCTMHHLKFVQISNIIGSMNELEFLKFLLKNGVVLKKMIVLISKKQWANNNNNNRFRKFRENLMKVRGESSSILFYENAVWIRKQNPHRIRGVLMGSRVGATHA